jgi:hypothetical protein
MLRHCAPNALDPIVHVDQRHRQPQVGRALPKTGPRGERENTARKVIGFMSSSQQDPDLLSHAYALQPTELLSVVEEKAPPSAG